MVGVFGMETEYGQRLSGVFDAETLGVYRQSVPRHQCAQRSRSQEDLGGQSNFILKVSDGLYLTMFGIWNPKNQID